MRRSLALILLVSCASSTWTRTVRLRHEEHVSLALAADPAATDCYQGCLSSRSPAGCLARCDGASVEPGPCVDGLPQHACFARSLSALESTGGRCSDPWPARRGETVISCSESAPSDSSGASTAIPGFFLLLGVAATIGGIAASGAAGGGH